MTLPTQNILSSLPVNADQAAFIKKVVSLATSKLVTYTKELNAKGMSKNGYQYNDYVITLKLSYDKGSLALYRNRDGALICSIQNRNVTSINWEYIFIDTHLDKLLKEING